MITNNFNLPAPIVRAVTFGQRKHRPGFISVTECIKPPQMRTLEIEHAAEITEDASDRLFALMGSAVHSVLERAMTDNVFQEEFLSAEIGGWTVTGKPDLLEYDVAADGYLLSDYKMTSVAVFFGGVKAEWEAQINCYSELFRLNGFPVGAAQIVVMLRDWSIGKKASGGDDYPPCPVLVLPVNLWPEEGQSNYLLARVRAHQLAQQGVEIPECTAEERWERPARWALIKVGNKRAHRVVDTVEAAFAMMGLLPDADKYQVHKRPGGSIRCESYCRAAPWCDQWAAIEAAQKEADLTYTG
ncbi:MAG: hypothetical protein EHM35_00925 [Planctomycetaceae bacterium]|nr:MAG: hypothetical protein EHM35_00925 [Planctomycetaceae bacterium]